MKAASAAIVVLLLVSFGQAQRRWIKTYGGTSNDEGNSVQQTSDGGYIVAGRTMSFGAGSFDVWLIKTDASGDTVWGKTYGTSGEEGGYFVQQTADSGYIISGYAPALGPYVGTQVYLVKTDASGNVLWSKTYGGQWMGGSGWNWGYCVRQTPDRGYIVVGSTQSYGAGHDDVWLLKTNASGDTTWTRTYGGVNSDFGYSVQVTSDSGYIIAGQTGSYGAGSFDVYLIKTNALGDTLWTRTYGGGRDEQGSSVQQTRGGGYIVAGWTNSFGGGGSAVYLIRTNAFGDTLWTRAYTGGGYDGAGSVQQTPDGGYIVTGSTTSFGAGNHDVWLLRTNASGDTLWTRTFGGTGEDGGSSGQQTSDGGYIITGSTASFGAGGNDVYLIKTDANGSGGVEEPVSSRQVAAGSLRAVPSPFVSFARIPGHEAERFEVYDISGKMVGTYRGDRIGEGLSPAVYFIKLGGKAAGSLRIVKVK